MRRSLPPLLLFSSYVSDFEACPCSIYDGYRSMTDKLGHYAAHEDQPSGTLLRMLRWVAPSE